MTSRTKNKTAEQRRLETVETLIDLAAEQNPSSISTQALADKMGLTQGAIFRHFPTKESIFSGVMGWVADRLMKQIHKAIDTDAAAIDQLESMFLAHISFVSKHPGIPRILFGELQHDKDSVPKQMVKKLIVQYADLLRDIIQLGQEKGELNLHLDVEAAILLFIGSIQGLVMQSMLADNRQDMLAQAQSVFGVYRQSLVSS